MATRAISDRSVAFVLKVLMLVFARSGLIPYCNHRAMSEREMMINDLEKNCAEAVSIMRQSARSRETAERHRSAES